MNCRNIIFQGIGQIVGMLVFHRHQLKNEQKLKVARSLLRVSWSLTFSTISDLVNALRPSSGGLYTVDELELFCQKRLNKKKYFKLHTFHSPASAHIRHTIFKGTL